MRVERIGNATLYLGDCLEILPTLPKVDAVITDPPYGVGFKYESHDDRPDAYEGGYDRWLLNVIAQCEALCTPGAPVFVWQSGVHMRRLAERFPRDWRLFVAAKNFTQMRATAMQYAFDPVVCWWIPGAKPWTAGTENRDFHIANTVPTKASAKALERGHPCPRPLDQTGVVVEQWAKPGGTVLDPFMGSGTTGVACAQMGRKFIGVEIEPKYFDIACKRIEEAYRQQPLIPHEPPKAEQQELL